MPRAAPASGCGSCPPGRTDPPPRARRTGCCAAGRSAGARAGRRGAAAGAARHRNPAARRARGDHRRALLVAARTHAGQRSGDAAPPGAEEAVARAPCRGATAELGDRGCAHRLARRPAGAHRGIAARRRRPEALERGPIILCLDTSGSMHGAPENIAKAVVIAALRVAHEARPRLQADRLRRSAGTDRARPGHRGGRAWRRCSS